MYFFLYTIFLLTENYEQALELELIYLYFPPSSHLVYSRVSDKFHKMFYRFINKIDFEKMRLDKHQLDVIVKN